jgi:hypothetical protein
VHVCSGRGGMHIARWANRKAVADGPSQAPGGGHPSQRTQGCTLTGVLGLVSGVQSLPISTESVYNRPLSTASSPLPTRLSCPPPTTALLLPATPTQSVAPHAACAVLTLVSSHPPHLPQCLPQPASPRVSSSTLQPAPTSQPPPSPPEPDRYISSLPPSEVQARCSPMHRQMVSLTSLFVLSLCAGLRASLYPPFPISPPVCSPGYLPLTVDPSSDHPLHNFLLLFFTIPTVDKNHFIFSAISNPAVRSR